jgi:hypothetical protein
MWRSNRVRDAGAKGPHPFMQRTSGFPVQPIARIGCGEPSNHTPAISAKAIQKSRLSRFGFSLRQHHAIAAENACRSIVRDILS